MSVNFDLQEEIQALNEHENYEIPHEHTTDEDLERLLEGKLLLWLNLNITKYLPSSCC